MSGIDVLMVGTGEYTTGYVQGSATGSDKRAGVVGLTLFDLRRRGAVRRLKMAGTNGTRFPGIRSHLQAVVADSYRDMDIRFESFPEDAMDRDPAAYVKALDTLRAGDIVVVFIPDDLHYQVASDAIARGCHVLLAKPIVKTLVEHQCLIKEAEAANVLVAMEVHKRWDPIYLDARDRIRQLGDFSYFNSYMSQPKTQLDTFRAWAGKSSDISYYLNAHHVDFHAWSVAPQALPQTIYATSSNGVARSKGIDTEDAISLHVTWKNIESGCRGTATYTSSWIAPQSDVHSQQRFFYLGHQGEINVDQAHRGYSLAVDGSGFASANPLFMKYTPSPEGYFAGQTGYGYRSIEAFVEAAAAIRRGDAEPADFQNALATVQDTTLVTAILEAGRRSLDQGGQRLGVEYDDQLRAVKLHVV